MRIGNANATLYFAHYYSPRIASSSLPRCELEGKLTFMTKMTSTRLSFQQELDMVSRKQQQTMENQSCFKIVSRKKERIDWLSEPCEEKPHAQVVSFFVRVIDERRHRITSGQSFYLYRETAT
jgi:hypothetical protein